MRTGLIWRGSSAGRKRIMAGRIRARERSGELSEESKRSHWMWWIFPQITGLGQSRMTESYFEGTARHGCRAPRSNMMTSTSQEYSIKSLAEAKAYLAHPVLGKNIREIMVSDCAARTSVSGQISLSYPLTTSCLRSF